MLTLTFRFHCSGTAAVESTIIVAVFSMDSVAGICTGASTGGTCSHIGAGGQSS